MDLGYNSGGQANELSSDSDEVPQLESTPSDTSSDSTTSSEARDSGEGSDVEESDQDYQEILPDLDGQGKNCHPFNLDYITAIKLSLPVAGWA